MQPSGQLPPPKQHGVALADARAGIKACSYLASLLLWSFGELCSVECCTRNGTALAKHGRGVAPTPPLRSGLRIQQVAAARALQSVATRCASARGHRAGTCAQQGGLAGAANSGFLRSGNTSFARNALGLTLGGLLPFRLSCRFSALFALQWRRGVLSVLRLRCL